MALSVKTGIDYFLRSPSQPHGSEVDVKAWLTPQRLLRDSTGREPYLSRLVRVRVSSKQKQEYSPSYSQ